MFRYDYDNKRWIPFERKVSYTATHEYYINNDNVDPSLPNLKIVEIVLTDEQKARLEQVREIESMGIDEITRYVMEGTLDDTTEMAPVVKQKQAVEALIKSVDLETVAQGVLETMKPLFNEWKEDTFYPEGTPVLRFGLVYKVRQSHTSLTHQPPDAEGMLAIYLPIQHPNTISDYDPSRNLGAQFYQVGELIRFPAKNGIMAGVYESTAVHGYNPWEYMGYWKKRADLT